MTMGLFFKELAGLLDQKRPRWRDNHIILIDNAPYHSSQQTLQYLEELKIPLMFLAPYSYDVAPCELVFAKFKQANINIDNLPVGKR